MSWTTSTSASMDLAASRRRRWQPSLPGLQAARRPSLSRLSADEASQLTTWAAALCRKKGLLLASLGTLTPAEVATEIAAYMWDTVIEQASHVAHMKEGRAAELSKLVRSASFLDRSAAALVHKWDAAAREERRRR